MLRIIWFVSYNSIENCQIKLFFLTKTQTEKSPKCKQIMSRKNRERKPFVMTHFVIKVSGRKNVKKHQLTQTVSRLISIMTTQYQTTKARHERHWNNFTPIYNCLSVLLLCKYVCLSECKYPFRQWSTWTDSHLHLIYWMYMYMNVN